MKVLVGIGHPAHVHFFRNVIQILRARNHRVAIVSRDKDVTLRLLDDLAMEHSVGSTVRSGKLGMACEYAEREINLYRAIRKHRPDIVTEIGGLFLAPLARMFRVPSVVFTDSEHVKANRYLAYPCASWICTPDIFMGDLGLKHVRYKGYHELSYLHPNWFKPKQDIRKKLGVAAEERFAIVRFVAWQASHDFGQSGFDEAAKLRLVNALQENMKVFITSEAPLMGKLRDYKIKIEPEEMHDAMYFADLFVGDGATMATEAGILGTPSVMASTLAFSMGNFRELMGKYELVYSYDNANDAIKRCRTLASTSGAKKDWQRKKSKMIEDKIDVAPWVADFLEEKSKKEK